MKGENGGNAAYLRKSRIFTKNILNAIRERIKLKLNISSITV